MSDQPLSGMAFSAFEIDVFDAIAALNPAQKGALLAQFRAARVTNRHNSGAGFFTYFEVDRLKAGPVILSSPTESVWADVDGFQDQMIFLVFLQDGYAKMPEGATIRDSTVGVDLSQLTLQLSATG